MTKYHFNCNNCGYSEVNSHTQGPCPNCREGTMYNNTEVPEKCFVATAAFGNSEASEVITLRRFRDNQLSHSRFGRAFIAIYYKVGPHMARMISNRPRIKKILRLVFRKIATIIDKE